jgi:hypothetical protein
LEERTRHIADEAPVEPSPMPAPFSMTAMLNFDRRASCQAMDRPMMPAPAMTTS